MVQNSSIKKQYFFQHPVQRATTLFIATVLVTGTTIYVFSRWQSTQVSSSPAPIATSSAESKIVAALGRLEPDGEVIQLSAPISSEGSRVEKLLVKQGDQVYANQVIAILDSRDRLQRAVEKVQEQVKVAQVRLAQVKAGAKTGEINAQAATIARLQAEKRGEITAQTATISRLDAELRNAETEYQRYQLLYQEGAISASVRDNKYLLVETIQQQLNEAKATLKQIQQAKQQELNQAKATLDGIAEVRPVDVAVAEAEVQNAIASVREAKANLDLAYVLTPKSGQILKIHTLSGEVVKDKGIVDLGQTSQMYVVAEVYQSDVNKIKVGQQVTITSNVLAKELKGVVKQIGLQIGKKDILDADPTADEDARVVEVKIRLNSEDSKRVAGLTNLQVKVAIEI
ncbi:MAG: ABC exporter membrane fusion protein [Nostoc desertorum CM1-VF14]|jgi:HlyD family secretion protein|nr:ABC exporter membrane fusion protein [Nostoc desertorum CM1-VF14]